MDAEFLLPPHLHPDSTGLFLDVDGTLLEFGDRPDAVVVDQALLQLLQRAYAACGGALALVSGRSLAQLDALFGPQRWPAAGLHGLERRDAAGRLHLHGPERLPPELLDELVALARRHPGLLLEDKGRAVAVHYRTATVPGAELMDVVHALTQRHGDGALHVQPGDYVLELKPSGITKAHAIDAFMNEMPHAHRTPLFAGDDLTDLHGFEAVAARGGWTVAIGPRVQAMQQLASPRELRTALAEFLDRGATK